MAATEGRGSLIAVSGELGVGKSRFCEEVGDRARQLGLDVVAVRCWVDGGAPPLWPWQPLLRELCGPEAAELLAEDAGQSGVDPDRFARFAAVTERLAEACARTPACLVIDDVHAADAGTLLLTRFVARSLHQLRLVLVLSRRGGPLAGAAPATRADAAASAAGVAADNGGSRLDGADGADGADEADGADTGDGPEAGLLAEIEGEALPLVLRPFDPSETAAFLAEHGLGHLDPHLLRTVFRVTGGNPLFLRRITALGPSVRRDALPDGVQVAIDQALRSLSPAAQRILRTSAVLGLAPSVSEAAAVSDTQAVAVLHALEEATAAGLVTAADPHGPESFAFSHELVRSTLEEGLAPGDRLDAHARAASVFTGDGPVVPADRLARRAHHALAAAPRSQDDARFAVAACREAARAMVGSFAYELADKLLCAAVRLHDGPLLGPPSGRLLVEWAQVALQCGRMTEARQRFARAASAARDDDPIGFAEAAVGLGGHWVNEHRSPVERARVLGLQRSALAQLGTRDVGLHCRLRARLAAEAVFDGGPIGPVYDALDATRRSGDPTALAEVLSLTHHVLFTPEHARSRLALAEELIRVASEAGHGTLGLMGLCWRAVDLFHLGHPNAIRALQALRERATALACQDILYIVGLMDVMLLIRQGRLAEAEEEAWRCYARGESVGQTDTLGYLAAHILTIRWLQGREDELVAAIDQVAVSVSRISADFSVDACAALVAAQVGDHERARRAFERFAPNGLVALRQSGSWLPGMLAVVEAAAVLDDADLAREAYDLLVPYADLPVVASVGAMCLGSTERVLGVAAHTFGDLDQAVDHLERAIEVDDVLENRPFGVLARANLAAALQRRAGAGDEARAAELLAHAILEADAMSLPARADRWRTELSELEARRAAPAGPALRPGHGLIRREAEGWLVALPEQAAQVPDLVGMRYLAELLTHPDRSIPALTLASRGSMAELPTRQDLLDGTARTTYARRAAELRSELAEADAHNDLGRTEQLRCELDALLEQLDAATTPDGHARSFVDEAERARTAVRKAIKRAIDAIDEVAPQLAEALRGSITTGTRCRYTPPAHGAITWSTR